MIHVHTLFFFVLLRTRRKFFGSTQRLMSTYNWPIAKIPSRLGSLFKGGYVFANMNTQFESLPRGQAADDEVLDGASLRLVNSEPKLSKSHAHTLCHMVREHE